MALAGQGQAVVRQTLRPDILRAVLDRFWAQKPGLADLLPAGAGSRVLDSYPLLLQRFPDAVSFAKIAPRACGGPVGELFFDPGGQLCIVVPTFRNEVQNRVDLTESIAGAGQRAGVGSALVEGPIGRADELE